MQTKLFAIMTIGGLLTWIFGLWLLFGWWSSYLSLLWMQLKLALVVGLSVYHLACWRLIQQFKQDPSYRSQTWLRWFNEVPAFFLIAIVILVIVRF